MPCMKLRERKFWSELAKCNQEEFRKSGADGQCIEARELIIALPESFTEYYPRRYVLALFTDHFKEQYGVECIGRRCTTISERPTTIST